MSLCLWAGADPRQRVAELNEEECNDPDGRTGLERAVAADAPHYLKKLGFDPAVDDFERLYASASGIEGLRFLVALNPPSDWAPIIERFVGRLDLSLRLSIRMTSVSEIEELFRLGARIESLDRRLKSDLRRLLLELSEWDAQRLLRLLNNPIHMKRPLLLELVSHEKLAARYATWTQRHGVDRQLLKELAESRSAPAPVRRMAQSRIMRPRRAITSTSLRDADGEHQLSRAELYDLVWSEPMFSLCKRFGLSDNGLRKRCKVMQVPTPPQGYWQALKAGRPIARTRLPQAGES